MTAATGSVLPAPAGREARVAGQVVGRVAGPATERVVRELYEAHYGRLVGWTAKLVGDRDLAHDFATEAFVRLLRHWDTVDDPRPWLYTTVGNLVRDHWRRRGREATAYQRWRAGGPGAGDDTPDGVGQDAATALSVRDAVEALPERFRLPVLLHYFADISVSQVARQLGKSEGAVKRDLHDARGLLAARLEGVR